VRSLISQESRSDLLELNELIESGGIVPAVTRILPLERATDALRDVDEGHGLGKVVITVSSPSGTHEPAASPGAERGADSG
jgi:D-arabinose 1-dehydrogenase-like Zn-dependent alcohol dehydrogenase